MPADNIIRLEVVGDAHPWVGKTVGNFTFTKELGRGRCATVLLAREDPPGRQVAVKVLSEDFSRDKVQVESFVEEARRTAKLRHSNILRIFRVALYKKTYFMVIEYASQGSVQDILERKGRFPLKEAVRIACEAANGLAFAEVQGIVHRDIKPANLLIAGDGTVKISDLGIAGTVGEDIGTEDSVYGSPHYMAPEQALGKPATNQSDIYSLGVTLYHMLTGKTPFKGKGKRSLILKHLHEEPKSVHRLVPILPKRVSEVVSNMMAKEPGERYLTFAQVLIELESLEDVKTLDKLNLSRRRGKER